MLRFSVTELLFKQKLSLSRKSYLIMKANWRFTARWYLVVKSMRLSKREGMATGRRLLTLKHGPSPRTSFLIKWLQLMMFPKESPFVGDREDQGEIDANALALL